jgi:hypothetical protein
MEPVGKEIFYMTGDATIFVVDSTTLAGPTRWRRHPVVQACPETLPSGTPLTALVSP